MKPTIKIAVFLLLLTAASSCKKDKSLIDTVQSGTWRVALFQEDNNIETADFSGYQFQFLSNGIVMTVRGSAVVNGIWSTDPNKLILNFGLHPVLNELNEDWSVIEQTTVLLRLKHASGGNGGTDMLTFQKIIN